MCQNPNTPEVESGFSKSKGSQYERISEQQDSFSTKSNEINKAL